MLTVHPPTTIIETFFGLVFISIVQEPSAKNVKSNDFGQSHLLTPCTIPLWQPLARGHKRGTRVFSSASVGILANPSFGNSRSSRAGLRELSGQGSFPVLPVFIL